MQVFVILGSASFFVTVHCGVLLGSRGGSLLQELVLLLVEGGVHVNPIGMKQVP